MARLETALVRRVNASVDRAMLVELRTTARDLAKALQAARVAYGLGDAELARYLDSQTAFAALKAQAREVATRIVDTAVREVQIAAVEARQAGQAHVDQIVSLQESGATTSTEAASRLAGAQALGRVVPVRAVSEVVGLLDRRSPFRGLEGLSQKGIDQIGDRLVQGVARGHHPLKIARGIVNDNATIPLSRARTIARTEALRAYRGAATEQMRQSSAVTGWQWSANLSAGSCIACIAMNGTRHADGEPMASHPNCRCTQVPITKTWADILGADAAADIPETGVTLKPGADWFAQQDEATQRKMLGPTRYADYVAGRTKLSDYVQVRHSAEWGDSVQVASAGAARASAS